MKQIDPDCAIGSACGPSERERASESVWGWGPKRIDKSGQNLRIMQIARVIGTVVSTQKNRKLEGAKLLLVQPLTLDDQPRGVALMAIDSVGAGVGEKVLVVIEGKAAGDALGKKAAAVDAAIIGIVDAVDLVEA